MCLISPPINWGCTLQLRELGKEVTNSALKKNFFSVTRIRSGLRDILLRKGR